MKKTFLTMTLGFLVFLTSFAQKNSDTKEARNYIYESFEASNMPPKGWKLINPLGGDGWQNFDYNKKMIKYKNILIEEKIADEFDNGLKYIFTTWFSSGANSMNEATPTDEYIVTPKVSVKTGTNLSFNIIHRTILKNYFEVLVSTTDNEKESFKDTLFKKEYKENQSEWSTETIDLSAYNGKEIYIAFREHSDNIKKECGFLALDNVKVGELPKLSPYLANVSCPEYKFKNVDIPVRINILNKGTDAIKNIEVGYIIDDKEPEFQSFNDLNIMSATFENRLKLPTPIKISEKGNHKIKFFLSKANGTTITSDTIEEEFKVFEKYTDRTVLLEHFTSEKCPNCPRVMKYINQTIATNNRVLLMVHHGGYYADFLTITPHSQMASFYNQSGTFAPAGMLDRFDFNANKRKIDTHGPPFNDGESVLRPRLEERLKTPAVVKIAIKNINYNEATNEVSLNVEVKKLIDEALGQVAISLWVTEDNIVENNQAGTDHHPYYHRFTSRKVVSKIYGDKIKELPLPVDETVTKEYKFQLSSKWKKDDLYVVAMLGKSYKGFLNKVLFNSTQAKLFGSASGVGMVKENEINVYPTISRDFITITNSKKAKIQVYSMLGQLIYSTTSNDDMMQINVSDFATGQYIIKIQDANNKIVTKRVSVIK